MSGNPAPAPVALLAGGLSIDNGGAGGSGLQEAVGNALRDERARMFSMLWRLSVNSITKYFCVFVNKIGDITAPGLANSELKARYVETKQGKYMMAHEARRERL